MVGPYKVKGQKRKKKAEKYDKEEFEQVDDMVDPKRLKSEGSLSNGMVKLDSASAIDEEPGIPVIPGNISSKQPGIIFVLEKASLEIAKVGKGYQLLSSDDHARYLEGKNRNPAEFRPDITFQAILNILDSRLNKSERLKALYVKTNQGLLLEIKPYARMPKTYKRFSGLIVQLLQKLHITASGNGGKLCRVIKNPVEQYLPVNCRKIGGGNVLNHRNEKPSCSITHPGKPCEALMVQDQSGLEDVSSASPLLLLKNRGDEENVISVISESATSPNDDDEKIQQRHVAAYKHFDAH